MVNKTTILVGYVLGIGAVGLAVAQMVSFEEFVEALRGYELTTYGWTVVLALVLVGLEIGAVPFLLRVTFRKVVWALSAACALLVPFAWTLMTVLAMMLDRTVDNAGYFGGFIELPVGGFVLVLNLVWLAVVWLWFGKMGGRQAMKLR